MFLSRRFWLIAAAVAALHVIAIYFAGGIVIFHYSKWHVFETTVNFFVHDIPAVFEGGKMVQPAERQYVISTRLVGGTKPPEPPHPAATNRPPPELIPPKTVAR